MSWLKGAAGRWLAPLALVVFVGGVIAEEGKEPSKAPKKEQPRARAFPFPDLEDLFDGFGPGLDPKQMAELKKQMEEARKRVEEAMRRLDRQPLPGFPGVPGRAGGRLDRGAARQEARLGAQLTRPNATLADQLDLPGDQGMVVEEVGPN